MGFLRTFIEKLESSGAVQPSGTDEPEPVAPPLAAAEAAIEEAIRQRQTGDVRAGSAEERRFVDDNGYTGPERRKGERRQGTAFGRRTRA